MKYIHFVFDAVFFVLGFILASLLFVVDGFGPKAICTAVGLMLLATGVVFFVHDLKQLKANP